MTYVTRFALVRKGLIDGRIATPAGKAVRAYLERESHD